MNEINSKDIVQGDVKRKTNGWEMGMPILQIFLIVFIILIMMSKWDSNSSAFDQITKIIFFIDIGSPIFSLYLLLNSSMKGKEYGIIAFIVSLIIPIILIFIGLTYGL